MRGESGCASRGCDGVEARLTVGGGVDGGAVAWGAPGGGGPHARVSGSSRPGGRSSSLVRDRGLAGAGRRVVRAPVGVRRHVCQQLHGPGQRVVGRTEHAEQGLRQRGRLLGLDRLPREDRHGLRAGRRGQDVDGGRRQTARCRLGRRSAGDLTDGVHLQGRQRSSTLPSRSRWCRRRSTAATSTSWTPPSSRPGPPGCRSSTAAAPARSANRRTTRCRRRSASRSHCCCCS